MHVFNPTRTGANLRAGAVLYALQDIPPSVGDFYPRREWIEAGGPLDAPEFLPMGGAQCVESLSRPGTFSASLAVTRAGCWQ